MPRPNGCSTAVTAANPATDTGNWSLLLMPNDKIGYASACFCTSSDQIRYKCVGKRCKTIGCFMHRKSASFLLLFASENSSQLTGPLFHCVPINLSCRTRARKQMEKLSSKAQVSFQLFSTFLWLIVDNAKSSALTSRLRVLHSH